MCSETRNSYRLQLELWVDEELVASGELAGGAFAARDGGLYLGGIPSSGAEKEGVAVSDELREAIRDTPAFTGTLADLVVDGELVKASLLYIKHHT